LVDKEKVVTSYPKAQQAAEDMKKAEDHVHKMIEDSNKQYEDAKTGHKSPAELEGLQRRLQGSIDEEVKKLQTRMQSLESQLEQEIDSAIKAEAGSRKVDTVLMKQAVLVGGVDLTDGVVKRLTGGAGGAGGAGNPAKAK
jgi:Skp family chaperone for outer membrane proteins